MRYEITLSGNSGTQVLEVMAGTFKKLKVWNVRLRSGQEAMLYKCGKVWLQRYTDTLEHGLLTAIGERIDHICLGIALS
jgi:hypothetical protein